MTAKQPPAPSTITVQFVVCGGRETIIGPAPHAALRSRFDNSIAKRSHALIDENNNWKTARTSRRETWPKLKKSTSRTLRAHSPESSRARHRRGVVERSDTADRSETLS
jgi:hypothetical protein